jgi:hypothetical protein
MDIHFSETFEGGLKAGFLLGGAVVVAASIVACFAHLTKATGELPACGATLLLAGGIFCYKWWSSDLLSGDRNVIYITGEDTRQLGNEEWRPPYRDALEDVTPVFEAIDGADKDRPLCVVICTWGGKSLSRQRILRRLLTHPAGYIAYCNEAYSAGAAIALGATEIVMSTRHGRLGKIDPQYEGQQMNLLVQAGRIAAHSTLEDAFKAIDAKQCLDSIKKELVELLGQEKYDRIAPLLMDSPLHHSYTIGLKECQQLGLPVREPLPEELQYCRYFLR